MKNLLDFTTPTGQHGNVLRPSTWIPLIIGAVVLLATFAGAQRIGAAVGNKLPFIDTTPNNPWQAAPSPSQTNQNVYYG